MQNTRSDDEERVLQPCTFLGGRPRLVGAVGIKANSRKLAAALAGDTTFAALTDGAENPAAACVRVCAIALHRASVYCALPSSYTITPTARLHHRAHHDCGCGAHT